MGIRMTEATYHRLNRDYCGICLACHDIADDTEPDAEGYTCQSCGMPTVIGLEHGMVCGRIEIVDDGQQNVDDCGPLPGTSTKKG